MDITAVFDNVDSAEHAIIGLRSLGVHPTGYKIRRVRPVPKQNNNDMSEMNPPIGLYNSTLTPGLGPPMALNAWTMNVARQGEAAPSPTPDGYSREVQLTVTVEDRSGIRAHRALVSNHGRQVRYR